MITLCSLGVIVVGVRHIYSEAPSTSVTVAAPVMYDGTSRMLNSPGLYMYSWLPRRLTQSTPMQACCQVLSGSVLISCTACLCVK